MLFTGGPPTDSELYVQETGRAGRDGKFSKAVLYYNRRDISMSSHVESNMREYCENIRLCRLCVLMNQFEQSPSLERPKFLHMCCDICTKSCTYHEITYCVPSVSRTTLSQEKRKEVFQELIELRKSWCRNSASPTAYLLVGDEVCTGLTNGAIEYILDNIYDITTEEQLLNLGVASHFYC